MTELTKEQQRFVDRVDAGESIWEETEPVIEDDMPVREPLKTRTRHATPRHVSRGVHASERALIAS